MPFYIKKNLILLTILFAFSIPVFSVEEESQKIIDESMVRIEQTLANGQLDIPFLMEPELLTPEQAEGLKNDLNVSIQENFDFYNTNRPLILKEQGESYEAGTMVLGELKKLNQNLLNFLRFLNHMDINQMPQGPMGKSVLLGATMKGMDVDYTAADMTDFTNDQKRKVLLEQTVPALIAHQFAFSAVNFAEVAYRFTDKSSNQVCEDVRKEFNASENNIFILDGARNYAKTTNKDQLLKQVCEVIETTYLQLASEPRLSPGKDIAALKEKVGEIYFSELNSVLPNIKGTLRHYHPETGSIYEMDQTPEDVDKGDLVEVIQLDDEGFQLFGTHMSNAIENTRGAFGMLVTHLGIAPIQLIPGIRPVRTDLIPFQRPYKRLFQDVKDNTGQRIANRKSFKTLKYSKSKRKYRRAVRDIYGQFKSKLGYFHKLSLNVEVSPTPVGLGPFNLVSWFWEAAKGKDLEFKQRELKVEMNKLRYNFLIDSIRLTPSMVGGVLIENPALALFLPGLVDKAQRKQKRLDITTKTLEIVGISTLSAGWGASVAGIILKKAATKIIARGALLMGTGGAGTLATLGNVTVTAKASAPMLKVMTSLRRLGMGKKIIMSALWANNAVWAAATLGKSLLYREHYRSNLHSIAMRERMPDNDFLKHYKHFRQDRNWAIATGLLNTLQLAHIFNMFGKIDRMTKYMNGIKAAPELLAGPIDEGVGGGLSVLKAAMHNTQRGFVQLGMPGEKSVTAFQKTVQTFNALFKATDEMKNPAPYFKDVVHGLKNASIEDLNKTHKALQINGCL